MKKQRQNLIFTLAYYNSLNYAPTTFELWKLYFDLEKKGLMSTYGDILTLTEILEKQKIFFQKNGFWFFEGNEILATRRIRAEKVSMAKIKKAKQWTKILKHLPFVRGIFITGTLAMKNSTAESDWDVWIVLAQGRIWLGRLFLMTVLYLFGKKRHRLKVKNRFCLNHFFAENGLCLEEQNEFTANELVFSYPLFNKTVHEKMLAENASWLKKIKPNFAIKLSSGFPAEKGYLQTTVEWILEFLGVAFCLNWLAKKIMIKKIKNNPKTYWKNADVRFSDQSLIFLPVPQRELILKKAKHYLTKIEKKCIIEA